MPVRPFEGSTYPVDLTGIQRQYVSSLLATRQPIFLYYWVPTAFAAIHNLQRVRFKEYACLGKFCRCPV